MRRITPLLFTLTLGACSPNSYFEGAICPKPEVIADFAEGDDLEVEILLEDCLPGCGGDSQTECHVTRDGSTIDIDAQGVYKKKGANGACAAVCQPLVATCVIGNLSAGTYTLNSGSHTLEITLPSDDPPKYESICGLD
jgi:hypothetical protein